MHTKTIIWSVIIIVILVLAGLVVVHSGTTSPTPTATSTSVKQVQVVAAENFWGSLVSQIGGNDVVVTTVVTDPNADPHDYEATANDARSVADADYVIENGVGYDAWMDKLLSASSNPNRKVLNVGELVGKQPGDNPHLWYQPEYVNAAIQQIEQDLIALDPSHAQDYQKNYAALQTSLAGYQNTVAQIKANYAGTKVTATEDIFVYLAQSTGLDLITPPAFIQAVGDGNDPPASTVATFQTQLKSGQVKVLLYNQQTVTPLTDSLKGLAQSQNIPIVPMTETVSPPGARFQDWMGSELNALQSALAGSK